LTVTELAQLSNLSKSYISQVKHFKCPPSQKLLSALKENYGVKDSGHGISVDSAIALFIESRREGLSQGTIDFYNCYLRKAINHLGLNPKVSGINGFLNDLGCSGGGKHAYYRAMRVFYRWLYSQRSGYNLNPQSNPILAVDPPKVEKQILPSMMAEQVLQLIDQTENIRDKAIISLFTDSGLRLSELASIKIQDIDWKQRLIRVRCKGNKEALATYGEKTEGYLKQWIAEYSPNGNYIWGINKWGIIEMLKQLKAKTGLPCNPHTFRRTFACLLRKAGVDTMTIKDLGRWESLEMVQRYTRSVTFQDSLKFYKAPLS
jgi:site-specific recombinase XerD